MVSDSGKRSEDYTTANALADALIQRDRAELSLVMLRAERDKARETVRAIRALHVQHIPSRKGPSFCRLDIEFWPCQTIRAMEEQP